MCCITAIWPGLVFYCYIYLTFIRTKKKGRKEVYRLGNRAIERCPDLETMWPLTTGEPDAKKRNTEKAESVEEGQRTRSMSQTQVKGCQQRYPEMQERASEKATFPLLVLDQMKRKLQKKFKVYILVIEEDPPRTCVISFLQILLKCYECTKC